MNSREQGHQEMQEGDPKPENKLNKSSSSSRSHWGGFRNPRIVRVSRSFGGKDRHSKVCTVRGLRDRRIRLSVPTAIQLYGLQDKLGLSQPSKVVDWLLDATKNDIDKLPPLQMPPGSLGQFFNPLLASSSSSSLPYFFNQNSSSYVKDGIKINDHVHGNDDQTMMDNRSKYCIPHGDSSSNIKLQGEKDKWIASNEQENLQGYNASQITAQNFFPILNQSSLTSSLPYNHPYYQLEANYSNLSLSQFGSNIFPNQVENQLYFYPSSTATTTIPAIVNPPLSSITTMENSSDPNRQFNHLQFLSSTSQHLLPNPLFPTLHFISSPMKSHLFKNLDPQENDKNEGGSGS